MENRKPPSFLRNISANVIGQGVLVFAPLIVYPLIIDHYGSGRFGVWTLLNSIIAYANISDLGIPSAMIKYISEGDRSDSERSTKHIVFTGIFTNLMMSLLMALFFFWAKGALIQFLSLDVKYVDEAVKTFNVGCIGFVILAASRALGAVLDGKNRMDLSNTALLFGTVVNFSLMIYFVSIDYGLVGLMWSVVIGGVVRCCVSSLFMILNFPELNFSLNSFSVPTLKLLLKYGLTIQLSGIASLFSEPLAKALLVKFLSPDYAGYFEIGMKVANMPRFFGSAAQRTLVPMISSKYSKNNLSDITNIYFRSLFFTSVLLLPIYLVIFLFPQFITTLWLGFSNNDLTTTIRYLSFVTFLSVLSGVPWNIALAIGNPKVTTITMWMQVFLLTIISWPLLLLTSLGYPSLLIGYSLSMIISSLYLFVKVNDQLFRSGVSVSG